MSGRSKATRASSRKRLTRGQRVLAAASFMHMHSGVAPSNSALAGLASGRDPCRWNKQKQLLKSSLWSQWFFLWLAKSLAATQCTKPVARSRRYILQVRSEARVCLCCANCVKRIGALQEPKRPRVQQVADASTLSYGRPTPSRPHIMCGSGYRRR